MAAGGGSAAGGAAVRPASGAGLAGAGLAVADLAGDGEDSDIALALERIAFEEGAVLDGSVTVRHRLVAASDQLGDSRVERGAVADPVARRSVAAMSCPVAIVPHHPTVAERERARIYGPDSLERVETLRQLLPVPVLTDLPFLRSLLPAAGAAHDGDATAAARRCATRRAVPSRFGDAGKRRGSDRRHAAGMTR